MPVSLLLRCNDLLETRRFYRDVLAFSLTDTAEGTLTAQGFDGTLIFTERDLWQSVPSLSGTIYFTVPDLDGFYSQVAAKATVAWEPQEMSYGSREFAVKDCNGYHLAFRQARQATSSRLIAAIPKLASLDIERSMAFFEALGFARRSNYPDYGIVERDGAQLHFWLCQDARIPKETACRIAVEGIEQLFEIYSAKGVIHPNGSLELKPWGVWEFSILDPDGNLVTFQQQPGV